jgi:hypothetical protein
MIKKKKGIELSVNFLVALILSIVVFVGGIAILNLILGSGDKYMNEVNEQVKKDIVRILNSGEVVSIPYNKEAVKIGNEVYFGVGINNKLKRETIFNVQVLFNSAFYENDSQILTDKNYINDNWNVFFQNGKNYSLVRNEPRVVDVKINVDSSIAQGKVTEKGVYIFDVNVTYFDVTGVQKVYKDRIYKLYLNVI